MNRFLILSLVLIGVGVGSMAFNFTKLYNDDFVSIHSVSTEEGATVHKKIADAKYDMAMDGDYMIHLPKNKYVLVSNVRGWWLGAWIPICLGLLCLIIGTNRVTMEKQKSSASESQ